MNTPESSCFSRRAALAQCFNGFGSLALGSLLAGSTGSLAQADTKKPHLKRKAKRCIFLFMQGGVSQMDSFEYKPDLNKLHGKPLPSIPTIRGELQGRLAFEHACVGSAFKFAKQGESGRYVSELFPKISEQIDDLAFIHGIKTDNQNHGPSTLHVTTGSQFPGSPSVGAWVNYGLGSENQNMPGYVVIQDPRGAPVNGAAVWSNGYLPASHQGTLLRNSGSPILNLDRPDGISEAAQKRELAALRKLNELHSASRHETDDLEARIQSYELAFRMQTAAPDLMNIEQEPEHIHRLYGLDRSETAGFGRQCLIARRLAEADVRYTMLIHGVQIGNNSWDDHGNVEGGMRKHSREVDLPVAGLLEDLRQRGMLEETLVVWASEMGRTPFVNGKLGKTPGREHNSHALTMWMAGGDVKPGATAGETDAFSLRSIGESISIRDVHATILNLLGLDDDLLRFQYAGRMRQLTDIGGLVLEEIIA
ncbi:MAG: DUF1501 domain-containing protein [Planctomycetota bacterium]